MITLEEAKQIALDHMGPEREHLKKTYPEDDLVIEHVVEFHDCWLFYVNSKTYLETRNILYRPIGRGPVITGKENGDVYWGASGGTEEEWVNEFREYVRSLKK